MFNQMLNLTAGASVAAVYNSSAAVVAVRASSQHAAHPIAA